jgi:hypothetical protein
MDKLNIMKKVKQFIKEVFIKEAECWTKDELGDIDDFNQTVRELHSFAVDKVGKGFGVFERDELRHDENPITYTPRHLYKLSAYNHPVYGNIWVAYASIKNPIGNNLESVITHGFFLGIIEEEIKIIGTMMIHKSQTSMGVKGWKGSIYNPKDLDIKKLGKFMGTERFHEPGNYDDFSLKEYLKDA